MKRLFDAPFFIRLRHWEYWNSKIVYAPLYPYWLWLSLKAGSLYFLTAANPRIRNGGYIMESKKDVYDLLPKEIYPRTIRFLAGTPAEEVVESTIVNRIGYPLIVKPDIGERGLGVKKIDDEKELRAYAAAMPVAYLVQQYIDYPMEVGIFYCRLPDAEQGVITGIVNKELVQVTGNGADTVDQLAAANSRYRLQWSQIQKLDSDLLQYVPKMGENVVLLHYGNHSRGSKFTNETKQATAKLNATFNRICKQIPEFYYGRLDIRFKSWEALERGEDFSVIELNGSGSEPTHIYDPSNSLLFAWREIIKHWQLLYFICVANNKRGIKYLTLAEGKQERAAFKNIERQLAIIK
jgi:hypothetical protein